jgi:DNA-binding transcriptional LysR family regulator
MDLRQLRYLVALAEESHFTRAAAREHIAQPALSQQIRRLEEEVGVPLVERTTRHVTITQAGRLLVTRARRILGEIEAASAELGALKGMESGHVSVGTMHTMGPIDVSLPLAIFHQHHPGIELTVREHSSEELAQMLRDDALDLAFLSVTERVESHGLGLHQLMSEELVAVLPGDHRYARRRRLRMADLENEEFISYREGARLRELLVAAGRHAGFQPTIKLESNESGRIRRLVARGMGVAILPRSDAVAPGAEVAVAALVDPRVSRDITLAWRQDRRHPPAVAEFLALARSTFADRSRVKRASDDQVEADHQAQTDRELVPVQVAPRPGPSGFPPRCPSAPRGSRRPGG